MAPGALLLFPLLLSGSGGQQHAAYPQPQVFSHATALCGNIGSGTWYPSHGNIVGTQYKKIDTNPHYACALTYDGWLDCWAEPGGVMRSIRVPDQAKDFYLSSQETCIAMLSGGVKCFNGFDGEDEFPQPYNGAGAGTWTAFEDMNVTGMAVAHFDSAPGMDDPQLCVLSEAGAVACYAPRSGEITTPLPNVTGATKVVGNGFFFCVQQGSPGPVTCWLHGGLTRPGVSAVLPENVGVAYDMDIWAWSSFCILNENRRVECWGSWNEGGSAVADDVDNRGAPFTALALGSRHLCAIREQADNDDNLVCWSYGSRYSAPWDVRNVTAIGAGGKALCMLADYVITTTATTSTATTSTASSSTVTTTTVTTSATATTSTASSSTWTSSTSTLSTSSTTTATFSSTGSSTSSTSATLSTTTSTTSTETSSSTTSLTSSTVSTSTSSATSTETRTVSTSTSSTTFTETRTASTVTSSSSTTSRTATTVTSSTTSTETGTASTATSSTTSSKTSTATSSTTSSKTSTTGTSTSTPVSPAKTTAAMEATTAAASPPPTASDGTHVKISMSLEGLLCGDLLGNAAMMRDVVASIKDGILAGLGNGKFTRGHIETRLFCAAAGRRLQQQQASVQSESVIDPAGTEVTPQQLFETVQTTAASMRVAVKERVLRVEGIDKVTAPGAAMAVATRMDLIALPASTTQPATTTTTTQTTAITQTTTACDSDICVTFADAESQAALRSLWLPALLGLCVRWR